MGPPSGSASHIGDLSNLTAQVWHVRRVPKSAQEILHISGREVAISNPQKIFFPQRGYTKLDLVRYFLAVAGGAVRGVAGRPRALERFPNGGGGGVFFRKGAPPGPGGIETVDVSLPS